MVRRRKIPEAGVQHHKEASHDNTLAAPVVPDRGGADKTEHRMTEGGIHPDDILLELARRVAGRYRLLAERSRLLEDAQLRLISMMESGRAGMDILREEKRRIEDMKSEISILTKEAETADRHLADYRMPF